MLAYAAIALSSCPTVSARDAYVAWHATYEDCVQDIMDLAILERVTSMPWRTARQVARISAAVVPRSSPARVRGRQLRCRRYHPFFITVRRDRDVRSGDRRRGIRRKAKWDVYRDWQISFAWIWSVSA
jgi:hypothetical protein